MPIRKLDNCTLFSPSASSKVIITGHIVEIVVSQHKSTSKTTKLNANQYIVNDTGEIKEYEHIDNRSQNIQGLRRTMTRIRNLINANADDVHNLRWITLTYAENMTDNERLYHDYEKFWKRFCYFCRKQGFEKPEYISVVEPQGRGAWHIHALFIWPHKAPYIKNTKLAEIWTHGFVSIKQPTECDNLGAYFSAYLTNMPKERIEELPDVEKTKAYVAAVQKDKKLFEFENIQNKKYIKGARLALYPPAMNIVRHSKGIKQPVIQRMSYREALELVAGATQTFTQAYEILGDTGETVNRILKSSYNFKRH